ncbi:MAG TPA: tetratricopeptide repeat protein [Caulobacteraceae bacterium]|jgi:tetratricopeptide (TPR) repeat protein|nr:tetratricopeptide repeat protein [Caulobacteraceae bacterium]
MTDARDRRAGGLNLGGLIRRLTPNPIVLGDAARDAGDWPQAVRCYREALAKDAALAPIWVQLGHALKESGDLSGAEDAYRRAIDVQPQTADSHLQLGHALKLRGQTGAAREAYRRALELDARCLDARRELEALDAGELPEAGTEPGGDANADTPAPQGVSRAEIDAYRLRQPDDGDETGARPAAASRADDEPLDEDTQNALALADRARDDEDWKRAVRFYRQALEERPLLGPIWVQLGHALKESGDIAQAEGAYRRAIAIDPEVADYHLQLGHALKIGGDRPAAEREYHRALAIDPASQPVLKELLALGSAQRAPTEEERSGARHEECIAIDLSDLFFYLRHHPTVSGIQRVQLGIAEVLQRLDRPSGREVRFVVDAGIVGGYVEISSAALFRLKLELGRDEVDHARLLGVMLEAQRQGSVFMPQPGDVLIVLGAFWVIENAVERFVSMKRAGVRLVVLVHDIIPITHPEFCEASLTDTFNSFCLHVLQIADLVLTVSDHTGEEVRAFLERKHVKAPPVVTLRSAHRSWTGARNETAPLRRSERLPPRSFVLFVSTIEIRKNHILLFRVWKQLIARHGARNVPKLVWVGRPGWRVKDLMAQLDSTRRLDGAVMILNGVSDAELARLYRDCLFTAFPSFEEGWGLPVGEGLIHGRPCLASRASSIPEVGGDFVAYTDPHDLAAALAAYERMIFDEDYREGFAQRIRDDFKPRTWEDVTDDLVAILSERVPFGGGSGAPMPAAPKLPAGRLLQMGHANAASDFIADGVGEVVHFIFDEGWYPVENFGRWMSRRNARMEFTLAEPIDGEIMLLLYVECTNWLGKQTRLRVAINGQGFETIETCWPPFTRFLFRPKVQQGRVVIEFEIEGPIAIGQDPRPLSYGVHAVAYCAADDLHGRLALMESLMFEQAQVRMVKAELAG